MTAVCENRLRWQSRRGVLELDLVLEEFWRRTESLPEEELRALSELLALDDDALWRVINGDGGEEAGRGGAAMRRVVGAMQNVIMAADANRAD